MKPTLLFAMILVWTTGLMAQDPQILIAPPMIDFQGRLADPEGNPVNASLDITFSLYESATGGTAFWSETQTVQVTDGLFQVTLGSVVQLAADLFQDADRWLGIQVGTEAEMSPRTKFSSVGFAFQAEEVNLVTNASLSGTGSSLWPLQIAQQGASAGQVLKWNGSEWSPGEDSEGMALWQQNGNHIYFNSGNVGIGITNPRSNFEIASSAIPQIRLNNTSTEASNVQKITFWKGSTEKFAIGYDLWGTGEDLFTLYDTPNLVPVLNIQNSNVGIGAFPENSKVHIKVNSNADYPHLMLEESEGDYARLTFKNTAIPTKYFTWAALCSDNDNDSRMNLWYYNGSSGQDIFTIRGNGTVGIGTDNPVYDLEINKPSGNSHLMVKSATNGAYLTLDMEGSYASNYSFINFKKGGEQKFTVGLAYDEFRIFNSNAKGLLIKSDGDLTVPPGGRLGIGVSDPVGPFCVNGGTSSTFAHYFNSSSGQGGTDGLLIGLSGTMGWLYNYENGPLKFGTNDKTVMTLDENGRVGIGTSTPGSRLHVKQAGNGFQNGLRLERPDNTYWWSIQINSYNDLVFDYNGSNTRAWIEHATAEYHYVSDRNLKTDINPVHSALSKLMQLNPVTFRFKSNPDSEDVSYGLIAQEVKEIYPEFVSENNGNLGIAYHNFSVVNIKAIQEQQEEIAFMQKQIEELVKQNQELQEEILQLKTTVNARLERLESLSER
ncbi:MAG: tail fiber domain-containing protein [Bacteroides sp.]|jgi:hypothetical protein|nr:tail fiber domain-containing protein [Bacteroides sp.]